MTVVRANKFGPECTRWLREFGWEFSHWTGGTHARFTHPTREPISLASSPSIDPRPGLLREIARKSGLSKAQVEERLGLANHSRPGPKRRRQRNEAGRRARTFTIARETKPQPERVGTSKERMESIAHEIAKCDGRLNLATGEVYERLLGERTRLRGEYLQLEVDLKARAA